jgi:hypothetical protein
MLAVSWRRRRDRGMGIQRGRNRFLDQALNRVAGTGNVSRFLHLLIGSRMSLSRSERRRATCSRGWITTRGRVGIAKLLLRWRSRRRSPFWEISERGDVSSSFTHGVALPSRDCCTPEVALSLNGYAVDPEFPCLTCQRHMTDQKGGQ